MNYIPNTAADRAEMLRRIGADSVDQLFADIPPRLRAPTFDLPPALSEVQLIRALQELADRNVETRKRACFLGAGAYNHFIPAVVHHITGRSEFYTAYTPYQAEVSQGTLQAVFEFQSAIAELTDMDVANASMYDGATAMAEAAIMARNITQRHKVVVAPSLHPEYLAVLRTYLAESLSTVVADWDMAGCLGAGRVPVESAARVVDEKTACLVVQHPNFFGCLEDMEALAEVAHRVGALLVAVVDPISLGLLKPPGGYDADLVVAEGQSLGNPLSFGGPYLGILAAKQRYVRHMPGRIVGQAKDADGRTGYVLALQTREQHIRRERSTSNICSNEALNALAALVYLSVMGKWGMRRVAELCTQKAHYAAQHIAQIPGFSLPHRAPFFKEFVVRCPQPPEEINAVLLTHNVVGGYPLGKRDQALADCLLLCVTEMNTKQEIDRLVGLLHSECAAENVAVEE